MHTLLKKSIAGMLLVAMFSLFVTPTLAMAEGIHSGSIATLSSLRQNSIRISDYLTQDDLQFIKNMEQIYPYFELGDQGQLNLTEPISSLKSKYNLDDSFISRLQEVLDANLLRADLLNNIHVVEPQTLSINREIKPLLHVNDWKIYFTYDEVVGTLLSAAQVGPAAIVAALTAMGTIYPGVGNVVGLLVGLIGGGAIAYEVFQAVANRKGLYIGINWNGIFPNPVVEVW